MIKTCRPLAVEGKKILCGSILKKKKSHSGKHTRVVCKVCSNELQGLVARMKKHLETCNPEKDRDDADNGGTGKLTKLLKSIIMKFLYW